MLGVSMGLLMLVNTTTGGTELGARLLKFPFPHLPIGKLCLIIDVLVVSAYAAVFHRCAQCHVWHYRTVHLIYRDGLYHLR